MSFQHAILSAIFVYYHPDRHTTNINMKAIKSGWSS